MPWLLDTNVLSELKRPTPSRKVIEFIAGSPLDQLYVSAVTIAEIRFGIHRSPGTLRRSEIEHWLAHTIRPMFAERNLAITEDIMLRWRLLVEDGRRTGLTFPQPDLIIAATALEHDLILATRNVKDFAGIGIKIVNPWET